MEKSVVERGGALIRSYIAYRLEREGIYAAPYAEEATVTSTQLFQRICALADEVEYRYVISYDELCTDKEMKKEKFAIIVRDLFKSGILWGRVVAMFAYVGALAVQSSHTKQETVLRELANWTDESLRGKLSLWIANQPKDWDSLVDHFRKPAMTSIHWTVNVLLMVVGLGSLAVLVATLQASCSSL
eukprot:m.311453 g.311453  ORF g.311453 m.311453 type:complete len:187 (+) comp71261_c0_seq1:98-658(+)